MSALPVKRGLRHSVSQWLSHNQQLSATAQHQQQLSQELRQEGRSLCNEASCKTSWDESDTSRRLSDRVWEVARWKETLETCAHKVDEEMEALTLSKTQSEQALAATAVPLEVSTECLSLREGRRGSELVSDPVEEQLQREVELIERVQRVLQRHINEAFEQLCVLQEVRHQLTSDLQNKMETLDIDVSCLSLTKTSAQISLKTNPTRIPPGSSTPQEWVQFSQSNVDGAQEAMRVSQGLREETSLSRANLQNELDTQRRATEFALRKRNHQQEQARDGLQWQIKKTEEEIADLEGDAHRLDADLRAKAASLKLAHTRLESRSRRPGVDLCRDEVQLGLVHEVGQLGATAAALQHKLSEAQHALQKLKLHRACMLQDLSRKQEALSLEQRSMNTRSRLTAASRSDTSSVPLVPLTNLQLLAP